MVTLSPFNRIASMSKNRHNDEERRQWVSNDEGLYRMQCGSRQSMRTFIRENRDFIDEVIDNVCGNKKPAHYLVYGG